MSLENLPNVTEASFQSAVIDLARRTGWKVMHTRPALNRSGRWSTPLQGDSGFPDLVLAHASRGVLFVELKTNRGRVSPEQSEWLNTLTDAGATAVVWRPCDWRPLSEFLAGRGTVHR